MDRTTPMLRASLLGPPSFRVGEAKLTLPTRRAVALVAVALLQQGEVSREHLATLLWGPGKRRNLRQELYWLRQAEGAERWLDVTRDTVRVVGVHDLEGPASEPRTGPLLQGLEGLSDAFDDWLADQRVRWADHTGVRGLVGVSPPPLRRATDHRRRVSLLLALCDEAPPPEVLADAAGLEPLDLAEVLQELEDVGITEDGELRAAERWQLRDEASPSVARVLHRRMAEVLEAHDGDPAMRAHHLEWAGDAQASAAWLDVGRRRSEPEALQRAYDSATDDLQRLEALLALMEEHRRRGEDDEVADVVLALDALALSSQHPVILARTAAAKALLAVRRGHTELAETTLKQAAEARAAQSHVQWARAAVYTVTGQPSRAEPLLRRVVQTTTHNEDHRLHMQALNALGACRAMAGAIEDADAVHHEALALARQLGDRVLALRLLNSLGANASRLGRLEAAAQRFEEAVHLAEAVGDRRAGAIAVGNLGAVWVHLGCFGGARSLVTRAVEEAETPRTRAVALHLRGELERSLGRDAEAARWQQRAAETYGQAGDAGQEAYSRFAVARARCVLGAGSLDDVREALRTLADTGRDDLRILASPVLAGLTPDPDEAEQLLGSAPSDAEGSLSLLVEALWLRVALLRGQTPELPPRSGAALGTLHVARYHSALAAAALDAAGRAGGDALRERVRTSLDRSMDGLLSSQQDALNARVEQWLHDPLGAPSA